MLHLFAFLAQAPAPAGADAPPMQGFGQFIPLIAAAIIAWVLLIRPQQLQRKQLAARIEALKTGDRVVTVGGIHGVVSNIKDGPSLTLKVDDNCKLTVDKSSIATVIEKKED